MYLVKVFIFTLVISSLVYIEVMQYVFNDTADVNIVLGIIVGIACGIGMVQLTWKRVYPES